MSAAGTDLIMVLNCGSSSIRFAAFDAAADPISRQPVWSGKVHGIGGPAAGFSATGGTPVPITLDAQAPYDDALERIRLHVAARPDGGRVAALAHRVVHGGSRYAAPVLVDSNVLADLKGYIPLAPLHQPFALDAIELLLRERPGLPQVACFDTAFHSSMPQVERMLPLPRSAWERGLRRYGFHGLSYAYMAAALAERHGDAARGRIIVAHLGSGASLCAMQNLRSVATTMGFSALDGLMMGTRCGSLDPGAVLYLMEIEKLTLEQVARLLYRESGLLGVSGISADPRVLLQREADDEPARDALALFVRRLVREIGALVAVLGGLDMLVFTAGIGENSAEIRRRVCTELGFLGVALDETANGSHAPVISAPGSRVTVGVEPTNEEWMVATQAKPLLPQRIRT